MNRFKKIKQWLIKKLFRHYSLSDTLWQSVLDKAVLLQSLCPADQQHLRQLTEKFIQEKSFTGVDKLIVTEEMKVLIAVQACLLILELDFSYFNGWVEIVLYPAAFFVKREVREESGIVSMQSRLLSGEAWSRGQVILSWHDVIHDTVKLYAGHQLILHEFAHKLDARSGEANGMPPLHADMSRERWAQILSHAYNKLVSRVEHHQHTYINDYAATNPAEYFAVVTEYFFTAPSLLKKHCEDVYIQMALFYRQDPGKRHLHRAVTQKKLHPQKLI